MKQVITQMLLLLSVTLTVVSCVEPRVDIPESVTGLAPVYSQDDWRNIISEDPRPVENLFKIYYKDSLLFVGESQKGIHVIDNSDPMNPIPIRFIKIIGNSDIAIRGNILYANNLGDLVSVDISDLNNIKVLNRSEDIFPNAGSTLPRGYIGFFECPDPNMGTIVGWVETNLNSPECWR
jgi:hypothetical protein